MYGTGCNQEKRTLGWSSETMSSSPHGRHSMKHHGNEMNHVGCLSIKAVA